MEPILALAILIMLAVAARKAAGAGAEALQNAWNRTHRRHSDRLGREHPDWSDATRARVALGRTLASAIHFLPETWRATRRGWSDARHEYGQGREAHRQWLAQHRERTAATKAAKRTKTRTLTGPGAPGSTAGPSPATGPGAPGSTAGPSPATGPGAPGSTAGPSPATGPGAPGSTAPPTGPTAPTGPPTGSGGPAPTPAPTVPDTAPQPAPDHHPAPPTVPDPPEHASAPPNGSAANGANAPSNNGGPSAANNGGTVPTGVTGETTNFEQTDQVFGDFGGQVGPVLNAADQMVAGLQGRGVDAETIGDATHISELAAELNAACLAAQENHRARHGALNEAHHTAPVRAAEREYYEGG